MSRRPFTPPRLALGVRAVRNVAGGGISTGARSMRDVASAFTEEPWTEERRTVILPAEMRQERLDLILFVVALGLFVLGLIMVFSAGAFAGQFNADGPYDRLLKQGMRGLFGLGLLVVVARIDYRRWVALSPWVALGTVCFLILVLLPGLGHQSKGAQRWIGFGPIVIQPTEFARIGLIIYLARLLSKRPERIDSFRSGPLPALLVGGAFMVLILLQKSLGSSIAIAMTALLMCVVAGMRWKHFFMIATPVAVLGLLVVLGAELFHAYQIDRVHSWNLMWQGKDDPLSNTYQLRQSIMTIGSGGWFGKGIGAGLSKWFFLPDVHTDFIFALIGEELGFAGAFGVICLFAALIWRGLRIAAEAEDRFGYLLASGLTINFAVYVGINLSVTMGLIPTTGLPLPLISYGGSALIANMVAVGLLLSVSRRRGGGIILAGRLRRRSGIMNEGAPL
jgi:cell division protein FtsW